MKKFFVLAVAAIFSISVSIIAYGIYLNRVSASHIDAMMASRVVRVNGMKVSYREIRPEIVIPSVLLRAEKMVDVIAQVDGTIVQLFVDQGQTVKKGQRICSVANHEIALQIARADTDIAKAEAAYHQISSEHARNQRLADKNAVAKSELESSAASQKAAKAELDAARVQRRQLEQRSKMQDILSPLDGYVVAVYQHGGAYVSAGSPILMIGDLSQIVSTLIMRDYAIKNIAPIDDSYSMLLNINYIIAKGLYIKFESGFDENFAINTKIHNVTPPLTESAPLRMVTVELDNDLALLEPGTCNNIVIQKNKPVKILAMPAILSAGNNEHEVYVMDADSKLAIRKIKTGLYNQEFIEVIDGLSDGDVVITSGVEGLELGSRLDVVMEDI
jgi:RND family efflux transporter MFP subunit